MRLPEWERHPPLSERTRQPLVASTFHDRAIIRAAVAASIAPTRDELVANLAKLAKVATKVALSSESAADINAAISATRAAIEAMGPNAAERRDPTRVEIVYPSDSSEPAAGQVPPGTPAR